LSDNIFEFARGLVASIQSGALHLQLKRMIAELDARFSKLLADRESIKDTVDTQCS
jgi:hypothetical protein